MKAPPPTPPTPMHLPAYPFTCHLAYAPTYHAWGETVGIWICIGLVLGMSEGIPCEGVNGFGGLKAYVR